MRTLVLLLLSCMAMAVDVTVPPLPPQAASIQGIVQPANGGTGVNNVGTLTVPANVSISGGGTVVLGGFTLTVGATETINGNISGGGTIATGGFTLTVAAASTVNGSLVGSMTGGGTVATGGFTLTVPATGTVGLLGTAATWTGVQTFDNPLIADTTDSTKLIAVNLSGATTGTTLTLVSSQTGNYSLTVPVLAANDTIATRGVANTFTAAQTFSGTSGNTVLTLASPSATNPVLLWTINSVSEDEFYSGTSGNFFMGDVPHGTTVWQYTGGAIGVGFVTFNNTLASTSSTVGAFVLSGGLAVGKGIWESSSTVISSSTSFTNGAGSSTGTLTNAPSAGNPTKWAPVNDNGTTRYVPMW